MSFFLRELLSFTFCLSSFRFAASALETNFTLHYAVFKVLLVGSSGLEPPTSRLSGVRSNQLSYEPISLRTPAVSPLETSARELCFLCPTLKLVEMNGFEPMTPCLQSRCSPS